jgi:hypothetical protein
MLVVAGIFNPKTSKMKPPIVTTQPRMKYTNGSLPHDDWPKLAVLPDMHLWYAGMSTNIDFRTMAFDITATAIPTNTRILFIIHL